MEPEVTNRTTERGSLRTRGRHRLASDIQVLIGIGSLLALLAVGVGVAVILIVSVEEHTANNVHRHVLYAAAIHEAALHAKGIANDQRGFLLSSDPQYLSEISTRTAAARLSFRRAAGYARGAAQVQAVRQSRAGFERWFRVLTEDIRAFRRGERERAIDASLGSTRELRKIYERSLDDTYALGTRSIESAIGAQESSASRSVTILVTYLAVALLLGLAVAVWVIRGLLRPAFTLSRNAIDLLSEGRVLVDEDERGSHHGVAVVVPIEVVNALADSALVTREALHPRRDPVG